jgi:hypothetical protein
VIERGYSENIHVTPVIFIYICCGLSCGPAAARDVIRNNSALFQNTMFQANFQFLSWRLILLRSTARRARAPHFHQAVAKQAFRPAWMVSTAESVIIFEEMFGKSKICRTLLSAR